MATATVKGKITRVFHNGTGAELTESYTVRGEEMKKRWSCWFESAHGLTEGAEVEISGLHSDKVDAWETKDGETRHTVQRSLNKARVAGSSATASTSAAPDPEPGASSETPF